MDRGGSDPPLYFETKSSKYESGIKNPLGGFCLPIFFKTLTKSRSFHEGTISFPALPFTALGPFAKRQKRKKFF
jgi:hypothetical protein